MSRDYVLFLRDIEDACRKIDEFSRDLTFEEFAEREMPFYSLVRLLEIVGEAVKSIPEEVRDRHPAVQWQQIARARDVMAHHYFGLEDETLWEMVEVTFLSCSLRFNGSSIRSHGQKPAKVDERQGQVPGPTI